MSRKERALFRLRQLVAEPRWKCDRAPLVHEAIGSLSDCPDDLVDVLLRETDCICEAAYECLRVMPLPGPVVARLESVVTCASDNDQVAWSLRLLAENEYTSAIPRYFVERALGLGGAARGAAVSAIPCVDADDGSLAEWLLEILDEGDESDCLRVMRAALSVSDAFAATILERASGDSSVKVASEGLYLVWYADLDREWTVERIRQTVDRWPSEESVLLPALYCIKDRRLQEFEDFVVPLMHHESAGIAVQAAEAVAVLFPSRAVQCLMDGALTFHDAVREVLRSSVQDPPEDVDRSPDSDAD